MGVGVRPLSISCILSLIYDVENLMHVLPLPPPPDDMQNLDGGCVRRDKKL